MFYSSEPQAAHVSITPAQRRNEDRIITSKIQTVASAFSWSSPPLSSLLSRPHLKQLDVAPFLNYCEVFLLP